MSITSLVERKSGQSLDSTNRISIPKYGWLFRMFMVGFFVFMVNVIVLYSIHTKDAWFAISILMPLHILVVLLTGWIFYKNPTDKILTSFPLVSVIIPIFNQKTMIEKVIESIVNSSYKNIEIVAVNDGSTDGTEIVLNELGKLYGDKVRIINKPNAGKRRAVAEGFKYAKGEIIVLIDSDSIIHSEALTEFVKAFQHDPKIGAVVGNVRIINKDDNLLTRCQDCWYDFQFNIQKTCESVYSSVTCCSGCLAGYRRHIIEPFIPYWSEATNQYSDDRELTSWVIAKKKGRKTLINSTQFKFMRHASLYDDADDRVLTANAMSDKWKSAYVSTALVFTDAPNNMKQFYKQQIRWKKGYVRTNMFVSTFFWQRNPLMAFLFYFESVGVFINPILTYGVNTYEVLIGNYWYPLFFVGLLISKSFMLAIDQRIRNKSLSTWKYEPLVGMLSTFYLSTLIFIALAKLKQNKWGTR